MYELPSWVEKKISPEPNSGCWLWTAAINEHGYGTLRLGRHKGKTQNYLAHRFTFEFYNGPILDGSILDHTCRQRACVNPDHLEAVTHRVNILRGVGVSAQNAKKLKCDSGHSLETAYLIGHRAHRKCRECQRANMARYYAKNRTNIRARRKKMRDVGAWI